MINNNNRQQIVNNNIEQLNYIFNKYLFNSVCNKCKCNNHPHILQFRKSGLVVAAVAGSGVAALWKQTKRVHNIKQIHFNDVYNSSFRDVYTTRLPTAFSQR